MQVAVSEIASSNYSDTSKGIKGFKPPNDGIKGVKPKSQICPVTCMISQIKSQISTLKSVASYGFLYESIPKSQIAHIKE